LSAREREILRLVVHSFISTAGPVGSRFLAKQYPLGLSPASIRNTMSDLEEYGYLDHPYTSAGRIPTELGYRTFVDELMDAPTLSEVEKQLLRNEIERLMGDPDGVLRESSRMLGKLSSLLGVVLSPRLDSGVLERLELVPLSSSRVMFVLSVRGSLVKTIILELETSYTRDDIDQIVSVLNERLAGLTLEEIRATYAERVADINDDASGVVRLILRRAPVLFEDASGVRRVELAGTQNILRQPEFQEPDELERMIEMLEDSDFVVQLLEESDDGSPAPGLVRIAIGRENAGEKAERYSVISARYRMGDTVGTVGVIGPTRMDYGRVVALVENMARLLSGSNSNE
jgi:heat-inducible transcriptional repressor